MSARSVSSRVTGQTHGFIRRIVSPGDVGELIKPFVFLDFIHGKIPAGTGFGFHPHSGIATLTYQLDADLDYEDTTGQKGTVRATGLEWMRAAGGTWHRGFVSGNTEGPSTGFQLWLALPPGVEDGAPEGRYIEPHDVPKVGNVRVLLGEYGGVVNPIPAPSPLVYLDVELSAGESWLFTPPAGFDVAWVYVYRGEVETSGTVGHGELLVYERGETAVELATAGGARFLFGAAKRHDHPLVLGSHSVHTNPDSLRRGVTRIRELGQQLKQQGRI